MRIPARILVPVVFALLCAAGILLLLWWQLRESTSILRIPGTGSGLTISDLTPSFGTLSPVDPRDRALLHLRQGDLLVLRGDWGGAQAEYELSVKNGGGLPSLRKLAQAQLQRRNIDGVRSTIRALRAAGARAEDLVLLESIVALRTGELVKAREILTDAADSPQKHYGLSLLSIVEGSHELAQQELQIVIAGWEPVLRSYARSLQAAYNELALFPQSTEIHLFTLLSRGLAQVHECELALPLLTIVTQRQRDYRDAWIIQGYCELTTERAEAAVSSLERAYNLDPSKPETQYFLARALSGLGEHDNALTFLEYALQNGFTPRSEIERAIAEEAIAAGKPAIALAHYTALAASPDAAIGDFIGAVTTGIALGETADAYTRAQGAVQKFPQEAKAYELLGTAAIELGKTEEARLNFQKAIEIDPFLESAKERLRTLDT
jgi:tetratricopeptide (TPR) repeat protein